MNQAEQEQRINAMPVGQWWRMEDIVGEGNHDPALWMHLCHMDDGQHYRESDGALFEANQTRIRFRWVNPA